MNYEVQQALNRKANDWQIHALESDLRQLKSSNSELSDKIARQSDYINSLRDSLSDLIQILIDSNTGILEDGLYDVKNRV